MPMNTRAIAAAFALSFLTACGGTQLAAPPLLTSQGVRTNTTNVFTISYTLESPCTGEMLTGFVTFTDVVTEVTDGNGGLHRQAKVTYSSTYTGDAGTTFTESGRARVHLNLPSSGVVNAGQIYNSVITGSDGTAFSAKEHFLLVVGKDGVVRVERNNLETNAYRCMRS